jgi:hypothetical protein
MVLGREVPAALDAPRLGTPIPRQPLPSITFWNGSAPHTTRAGTSKSRSRSAPEASAVRSQRTCQARAARHPVVVGLDAVLLVGGGARRIVGAAACMVATAPC